MAKKQEDKWQEVKLQDCISKVIDNRGKNPSAYYSFAEYPVIDNFLIKNELHPNLKLVERYIDNQTYQNFLRGYTYPGMVIMTLVGNGIGNVSTIENNKCVIIQNTIGFAVNKHELYDLFLYYLCLYKQEEIKKFDRGSGQPSIKKTDLLNMSITLPPLEVQKKIAGVLGALDDKIDLNNKINQNLEAQALFKSWFVDFEPFGGKMPDDWKIGKVEDIAKQIICGKTPSTKCPEYYGRDIPFITIPDMHGSTYVIKTERYLSNKGANIQIGKTLPPNSICVSCIGTAGLVSLNAYKSQTNQQINSIIANDAISPYYIYLVMKSISDVIKSLGASGSTICNLNKEQFSNIDILIPSEAILSDFHKIVSPQFDEIKHNLEENIQLAELRDTLLPKLMSGEINVDDVKID